MKLTFINKKTGLSLLFSFLFFVTSYGQVSIADSNVCTAHHLGAQLSGVTPISSGITVDDGWSGVFQLNGGIGAPFTFNYFGNNYTSCIIGGNGLIGFNIALASTWQNWSITSPLLGNTDVLNSICGPWADICLPCNLAMGSITYSTSGVAPNRRFCATWCSAPMYSCTAQWTTSQIILYETTNVIEVHIRNKTICASWNSGRAIVGVQNATGTVAVAAPGRDFPSVWSVTTTPEAWRFTPSGSTYTCASIPYSPLPFNSPISYWYDSVTNTYLGSGNIVVSPTVTTTYKAAFIACKDTVIDYITVTPTLAPGTEPTLTGVPWINPSECGACDGVMTLTGVRQHQIDTVHYTDPYGVTHTFVDSASSTGTIVMGGLCAGIYSNIYITVGTCRTPAYNDTLVTPTLSVSHVTFTNPTVCGRNDGTVTIWGLTPSKPDTVTYTDALGPHTVTGVVGADSSITLTGLVGYSSGATGTTTYTFNVKVRFCSVTATATLTDPPPYIPTFDTVVTLGCEGDRIDFNNTTVPGGYYSFWTFGDGATDNTASPFHVFATHTSTPKYTGNYVITLAYNTTPTRMAHCEASVSKAFQPDHQIHAVFTTDVDTTCLGVPFHFINSSTTHYNPTYLWTYQPGVEETTTDVTVIPSHAFPVGGKYRPMLKVTDAIGCVDSLPRDLEVVSINVKAGFGLLSYSTPNGDSTVCLYNGAKGLESAPDSIFLRAYDSVVYSQKEVENPSYHIDWTWIPSSSNPATGGLATFNTQFPKFAGLGNYTYTVIGTTNTFGCSDTQEVVVHSYPPVVLTDLTPSGQIVTLGSTIQLHAAGAAYYWWTPDDGSLNDPNINNPVATPHDTTTVYTVHGMSLWGCPSEAKVVVYVDNGTEEFVPSAFTPNGDGLNDVFRPLKLRFQKLVDFRVFNRWGQLMYQTITPDAGWDGSFKGVPQDMGTYHYSIIIQRPDGKEKQINGTVNLIR
jgi:gliding motility-associated-like protein